MEKAFQEIKREKKMVTIISNQTNRIQSENNEQVRNTFIMIMSTVYKDYLTFISI